MKSFASSKLKKSKNKQSQVEAIKGNKLVNKVIKKIKSFTYYELTEEQNSLLKQLIPYEELRERYRKYGLCLECQQPNTGHDWCQICNAKHFIRNFKNWTSGNLEIDKLIKKCQLEANNRFNVLEWISHEQFTNIEYLAEGGFGKVYKAYWERGYISSWDIKNNKWNRSKYSKEIILKSLNNLQNKSTDFLHEVACYKLFSGEFNYVVKCYGISYNSQTTNYLMVMQYIPSGNLHQYLQENYNKMEFRDKIVQLRTIIKGLNSIHQQDLIHRDFHPGNILNQVISDKILCYITDLGLSRLVKEKDKGSIYGVLPYIAPEVLRCQPYTQASDIYSWGMIAYEVLTGFPPYHKFAHDEFLTIQICKGLRPHFSIKLPPLLEDLISKCWDANPLQRPTSDELYEILNNWYEIWVGNFNEKNVEFAHQYQESEKFNQSVSNVENDSTFSYETHHQAVYTSRILEFSGLPEPQNSKEINKQFYRLKESESLSSLRIIESTNIKSNIIANDNSKAKAKKDEELPPIQTLQPNNYQNLHPNFTSELTQNWQDLGFTFNQTRDWINVNSPSQQAQAIQEPHFYAWLRDEVKITPQELLNELTAEEFSSLREQFQELQLQSHQELPPRGSL